MRAPVVAALALLLAPAPAAAGDAWPRLHGQWRGGGEVSGMAATIGLTFRPALAGRGHHLRFENRMRGADGSDRLFSAEAVYLCEAARCRGHWYDSRGAVLPLVVEVGDGVLHVDWGDDAGERGRTEYRLDADGTLHLHDEVRLADGSWRSFGRSRLLRQP